MAGAAISLRMSVEGDAEARAKLQALGTSAEAAAGGVEQIATRSSAAFERFAASIDPAIRAQQNFERAQRTLNEAVASGATTQAEASRLLALVQGRYDAAAASARGLSAASNSATSGIGGQLGAAAGQVQGLVTQVQGGANAWQVFGDKAKEILTALGPAGAVAGVILSFGLVQSGLASMGENAAEAARRTQTGFDAATRTAEDLKRVLGQVNDLFLTQAQRSAAAANAQTAELRLSVARQMEIAQARQEAAAQELGAAEREAAAQRQTAQDYQAMLARSGRMGGQGAAGEARARGDLFAAEARVAGLRAEMSRMSARLSELSEAANRARNAGVIGADEYGPPAPERERAAGVERLTEAQREYQRIMQEAEGQVTRLMTEEDRRGQTLNRLFELLRAGGITNADYTAALETQGRAVAALQREEDRRAEEQRSQQRQAEAQRLATELDQQNRRTTDSIVRYGADAFADLFEKNGRGWKDMLDSFLTTARRTFARIAAEAVIRPIVAPIVSSLGLGGLDRNTSLSGNGGAYSQVGSNAFGGGVGGSAQQVGVPNPSSLRGFTDGTFNSGFSSIDGVINTPLYSTLGPQYGPYSAAAPGTAFSGGEVTVGGAAAGALGIVGGAYGIYSGIQTGGAKGTVQAVGGGAGVIAGASTLAGGSAAVGAGASAALGAGAGAIIGGIAAVAPYVAIIAAIVAALIPAQKPSNAAAGAQIQFPGGEVNFLDSGKSTGATRQARDSLVDAYQQQIAQLTSLTGGVRLSGSVGFNVGARDSSDVQYYNSRGQKVFAERADLGDAERLSELVGRSILYGYQDQQNQSNDLKQIFKHSPDLNAAIGNLQFYQGTYRPLIDSFGDDPESVKRSNAQRGLEAQLTNLTKLFDDAAAKAASLGLATEQLAAASAAAIVDFQESRSKQRELIGLSLDARLLTATGRQVEAALIEQRVKAEQERENFRDQLIALAPEDSNAGFRATALAKLDAVQAAERQQLLDQQAANGPAAAAAAISNQGRGFFEQLVFGNAGGLSPAAQYGAGLTTLSSAGSDLLAGGGPDALATYTRVASSFLPIARDYLGTSEAYASLVSDIAGTVRAAGGDPAGIASIFDAQASGFDRLGSELSSLNANGADQTRIATQSLSELRRLSSLIEALIARRSLT